ncbi:PEP/pyruvate-binding domain-containing protein [Fibrobacter sp. UWB12]|uniref:PEP/pyruvate-binding domain-containing protein n=1 Tax=Fibrobacter sp. UWB12 TaxID=1896203 RepID=UPI0009152401|nr:PEP/pyruvate-binding domain-containing protein [Fibrobacter sp. UWB12]SHK53914.1 Pyruvate phosphate dikinase, PEP/pyruvate binding domain [Fibrobacter sp. UWB12]
MKYCNLLFGCIAVLVIACGDDSTSASDAWSEVSSSSFDFSSSSQAGPVPESSSDFPLPIFIQNDDQYTGFYKQDGYDAFRKLSYTSKTEMGASYLVKILISDFGTDSAEVHFMNSNKFIYHYDFAEMVLGETRSLAVFNQETYFSAEKNTVAGTLAYYASVDSMIALTFFPTDYITPVQVAAVYRLVQDRLLFLNSKGAKNRLFYMPAGSTAERAAAEYANEFKKADILVFTHAELFGDIPYQIMNTGTAYGTLRKLSAAELDTAIVSSHDILILETLPAEIPLVAATISKDAQTPLSHVNLAAQARKTPNIAFNGNELPDSLLALCGKLVKLDVKANSYTVGETSLEKAQAFWNKNVRNPIKLTYDLSDSGFINFANLNFKSSKSVGVKAANLAELHKLLPENTPDGFAVPFYHYSHFMDYAQVTEELCGRSFEDCGKEGRSSEICTEVKNACVSALRQVQSAVSRETEPAVAPRASLRGYITNIIARDDFKTDTRLREAMLDNVRYMFKHIPVEKTFGDALDAKVRELYGEAGVRLRSSTNSEDLEDFNGAGLYKSVKATAREKDLPSDEIRKVWASVWSFKVFEERTLWNIDHMSVQMAVAVHEAYPDEVANGVIITQNIADYSVAGIYANIQVGETSITNPEGGELPEIISIIPSPPPQRGVQSVLLQHSSLSPDSLILSDGEIYTLYQFVQRIQNRFAVLYNVYSDALALDIEFKVMGEERKLIFKQVRPYIL